MLDILLLAFAAVKQTYGVCNDSKVLSLPVQDVVLSNDHTMRGVYTSVGTPMQNISMMPQP